MNSLLDNDDEPDRNDRELTLSTGTILVIFFGLVLLCGLFFGFGYRMGSHRIIPPAEVPRGVSTPPPSTSFGDFKPAAGSPSSDSTPIPAKSISPTSGATSTAPEASRTPASTASAVSATHGVSLTQPQMAPTDAPASPSSVATGSFVVQVAAVSHEEDAELLVNALKAKGYPVSAHTEPQDKFFHIQVGPFNNRKDADAAKQRLLADGYQPIVK